VSYRVGIVGAGFGEKAHLPSFLAHPAFEVVAIASPHSAKRIAHERNIAGFQTLDEMLKTLPENRPSPADVPVIEPTADAFQKYSPYYDLLYRDKD